MSRRSPGELVVRGSGSVAPARARSATRRADRRPSSTCVWCPAGPSLGAYRALLCHGRDSGTPTADATRRPAFPPGRSGDGCLGPFRVGFGVFVPTFDWLSGRLPCGAPWWVPFSDHRVAGSSPAWRSRVSWAGRSVRAPHPRVPGCRVATSAATSLADRGKFG